MRLRRRQNESQENGAPEDSRGQPGGVDLARLRESVGEMLDAGNAAIERALSGDSEQFLRASRQQGGE
jgi:hypothetical protein